MATEQRLISADVAKEMIVNHANEFSDVLNRREKALLIGGGTSCIDKCPTVDAVEVPDKDLLRAIRLLIKQYEHSKNSEYVHSPVAHALFHTWKQVDERRTNHV